MTNTMSITTFDGVYKVALKLLIQSYTLTRKSRYSTEPFASANGQIPQLNLWDDHDVRPLRRPLMLGGTFESYINSCSRLSMASGHMSMILCVVQSFEGLEAQQTSITSSFNIT